MGHIDHLVFLFSDDFHKRKFVNDTFGAGEILGESLHELLVDPEKGITLELLSLDGDSLGIGRDLLILVLESDWQALLTTLRSISSAKANYDAIDDDDSGPVCPNEHEKLWVVVCNSYDVATLLLREYRVVPALVVLELYLPSNQRLEQPAELIRHIQQSMGTRLLGFTYLENVREARNLFVLVEEFGQVVEKLDFKDGLASIIRTSIRGFPLMRHARESAQEILQHFSNKMDQHFISKRFSAIATLLGEGKVVEAKNLAMEQSTMARHCYNLMGIPLVTLDVIREYIQEEVKLLRHTVRCDIILQFEITGVESMLVPPMLVQTLVENAICHGGKGMNKPLTVTVRFQRDPVFPQQLLGYVIDNGIGYETQNGKSNNALATITNAFAALNPARGRKLYDKKIGPLQTNPLQGTCVELFLPLKMKH